MDKIPTVAEWVTIIEAVGDQYVRVEWAEALSRLLTVVSTFGAAGGVFIMGLFVAKKLGAFD